VSDRVDWGNYLIVVSTEHWLLSGNTSRWNVDRPLAATQGDVNGILVKQS
jgi:hypothetical protein